MKKLSDATRMKVINDLVEYKTKNNLTNLDIAKKINGHEGQISKWLNGGYRPTTASIKRLISIGATDVKIPEELRANAIKKVLTRIDNKNKVPRRYNKRVDMPDIVRCEVNVILDHYIRGLGEKKSLTEHMLSRDETIQKLYYTIKQGERA